MNKFYCTTQFFCYLSAVFFSAQILTKRLKLYPSAKPDCSCCKNTGNECHQGSPTGSQALSLVESPIIEEDLKVTVSEDKSPIDDFPITSFMRFLKRIGLKVLLKRITDKRALIKTRYKMEFILQWALSVFFFRTGSLNELQQAFDKVTNHKKKALWNFFAIPEGSPLPQRQTVTNALALIDPSEINKLLSTLFKWALKSKVFYNHKHVLSATFYLAFDGFTVHHYQNSHSVDEYGCNACPYCLARVYNKGLPNERTFYLHVFVNVAIILPGGIQLPLYVHALKAQQVQGKESASEEEHKQECELQAAKEILPIVRQEFSRLSITILADSLYANEPFITLCKEYNLDFLIVRQEGSLKKLAKHCDELEGTKFYESYRLQETVELEGGEKVVRSYKWFNGERVGDQEVHILRFEEVRYDEQREVRKRFKTEWLSSVRIYKYNCASLAKAARKRADHEDLHNTLKNRGFNAKHDYARSNANGSIVWKLLMFVAFWIFELFSCTVLAQKSRGSSSWRMFAKELLTDLLRESWENLSRAPSLAKEHMQFRFDFSGH
ncbi:MAG: hypothetical protein FJZ58_07775 [Chlamydiae bacterium]|nr:hypothetical protein [Chlamydiota bacterium]